MLVNALQLIPFRFTLYFFAHLSRDLTAYADDHESICSYESLTSTEALRHAQTLDDWIALLNDAKPLYDLLGQSNTMSVE